MYKTIWRRENCQKIYLCGRQNVENADIQPIDATCHCIDFQWYFYKPLNSKMLQLVRLN